MGAAKSTLLVPHFRSSHNEKKKMAQVLPQGDLAGPAKLKAVTELMNLLAEDLIKSNMPSQQRDAALEQVKIYGRDPRDADPIFTKKGVETLTKHAFDSSSATTSRNALRCLANTLLLKPDTRQIFVDLGYQEKACNKLKSGNLEDEFLVSRIIFLTTYGTNIKLETLVDQYHLADSVIQILTRYAKLLSGKPHQRSSSIVSIGASSTSAAKAKARADPLFDMALTETAKLLFNVTHFCKDRVDAFSPAIEPIVTMICKLDIPQPKPLDPPLGSLVNVLLTLDLASEKATAAIFPLKGDRTALTNRLIELLDLALHKYGDAELDQTVLPLVAALRKIIELEPPTAVHLVMLKKLLPSDQDRKNVLGRGDNLPSLLLKHTTNALAPEFRAAVSHMLFELSGKDATRFVQNVGYGFASGFLFQNNIPIPTRAQDTPDDRGNRPAVNTVTGQFLDAETGPDLPEMTDEEKEREAERLFVLFERLKKTGVVDVMNPVEQAMREGRLEGIDDSKRVEELD